MDLNVNALMGFGASMSESSENVSNSEGKSADKRKQSLYFPADMLAEMKAEADRLDRSLSWVVQRAWKLSRAQVGSLPSVEDVG